MQISSRVGRMRLGLGGTVVALLASGCGELVSWDERWIFDGGGSHGSSSPGAPTEDGGSLEPGAPGEPAEPGQPGQPVHCEARPLAAHHYAEPPEFWLGAQSSLALHVDGPGYLVAGPAGAAIEQQRFVRDAELSVAPDGTLELGPGEPALGYAPDVSVGGSCLVELRAPIGAAPQETSRIDLVINFDARSYVFDYFDVLDASGTSNGSTSVTVFDSLGAGHVLEIYFSHTNALLIEYHVLVDGGDLAGGTPGYPTEVSNGLLQFNSWGALDVATTPEMSLSFSNSSTVFQSISIDFGRDIANDATDGYEGSTMFADDTAVYSQSVDGFPSGTGTDFEVDAGGRVRVLFDSGHVASIGTLALARFPNESELAALDGSGWAWTPDSGIPQFLAASYPGRGALRVGAMGATP